jgi:hypothetical protein
MASFTILLVYRVQNPYDHYVTYPEIYDVVVIRVLNIPNGTLFQELDQIFGAFKTKLDKNRAA